MNLVALCIGDCVRSAGCPLRLVSLATALGMNRLKRIVLMNLVTVCGAVYVSGLLDRS